MHYTKKLLTAMLLSSMLLPSCRREEIVVGTSGEQNEIDAIVTEVSATIADYVFDEESETKSYMSSAGKFTWASTDFLMFWPKSDALFVGDPVGKKFRVKEGGSSEASFIGNGWGLQRGATYYVSYPSNLSDEYNKVTLSMTGQNQQMNMVAEHCAPYCYMHSGFTVAEDGDVSIAFDKLVCLTKYVITLPAEATYKLFTSMTLSSDNAIFATSATYDPRTEGEIVLDKTMSKSMTLTLNGTTGFAPVSGVLTLFLEMIPSFSENDTVNVMMTDSEGAIYNGTFLVSKTQLAGKAYVYRSTVESIGQPLALEPANSYIITEPGIYALALVKGNSSESIGDVASVDILWELNETGAKAVANSLVSSVKYTAGRLVYITTGEKGNALLAARDADGKILWSWHIWMTDQPSTVTYNNNAGVVMDRNLGATSTNAAEPASKGLYYQWGRKDPFSPSTGYTSVLTSATTGTIEYVTANPTVFVKAYDTPVDWVNTPNNNLWGATKTIYDPCPAGYMIPSINLWVDAFDYDDAVEVNTVEGGVDIGSDVTNGGHAVYPEAGFIFYDNASFSGLWNNFKAGIYWTYSMVGNDTSAFMVDTDSDGTGEAAMSRFVYRASGVSVRCVVERK